MQMLRAMHEAQSANGVPTKDDDGKFIPEHLLLEWHCEMQKKRPQVYPLDDRLFGSDEGQYPYGTKLPASYNIDPNRPVYCEVKGSKWHYNDEVLQSDNDKEPMYVISIYGYLHLINMKSAHQNEAGWTVVTIPSAATAVADDDNDSSRVGDSNIHNHTITTTMSGGNVRTHKK